MRWTAVIWLLPGVALAQEPPQPAERAAIRGSLAALERSLDRAVTQVALPSPFAALAGPGGSHGYYLRGQGAVFVLPPRRLPMAHRVFVMRHLNRGAGPVEAGQPVDELSAQIEAMRIEAERAHQEAEQAFAEVRRQIVVRLGDNAPLPEGAGAEGETPPPPWHFWFESPLPAEPPDADTLVGEVREAVTAALESDAARLPMLAEDEFVAVTVDFVAQPFFPTRSGGERTLIVRARKGDLDSRRAGRLTPEQLRERIVYEEY